MIDPAYSPIPQRDSEKDPRHPAHNDIPSSQTTTPVSSISASSSAHPKEDPKEQKGCAAYADVTPCPMRSQLYTGVSCSTTYPQKAKGVCPKKAAEPLFISPHNHDRAIDHIQATDSPVETRSGEKHVPQALHSVDTYEMDRCVQCIPQAPAFQCVDSSASAQLLNQGQQPSVSASRTQSDTYSNQESQVCPADHKIDALAHHSQKNQLPRHAGRRHFRGRPQSSISALRRLCAEHSNLIDALLLTLAPIALIATALGGISTTAALSAFIALVTVIIFLVRFDRSRPYLHELMPIVVLVSVAVAGRILFIAVPSFKPMLAITIIAGICLSRQSGFMVGALCMLVSNMVFGQGPWTPWQMYAMGLFGYLSGTLFKRGMPQTWRRVGLVIGWGGICALGYGIVLDTYHVVWFVQPPAPLPVLAAYLAGLPFNLMHAGATMIFLMALALPWSCHLSRIATKYGLENLDQPFNTR